MSSDDSARGTSSLSGLDLSFEGGTATGQNVTGELYCSSESEQPVVVVEVLDSDEEREHAGAAPEDTTTPSCESFRSPRPA